MNLSVQFTSGVFSIERTVAITAVVCSLVFLVIGVMVGALCGYRLGKQRNLTQLDSLSGEPLPPPAARIPLYDEVVSREGKHNIELKDNVAYGPI